MIEKVLGFKRDAFLEAEKRLGVPVSKRFLELIVPVVSLEWLEKYCKGYITADVKSLLLAAEKEAKKV